MIKSSITNTISVLSSVANLLPASMNDSFTKNGHFQIQQNPLKCKLLCTLNKIT